MGQVARLGDLIKRLAELDSEGTIYATKPWMEQSEAMVAREPDIGGLPPEAADAGMMYFLDIFIAQEVVEDWLDSQEEPPTSSAICQRVIDYAINDA